MVFKFQSPSKIVDMHHMLLYKSQAFISLTIFTIFFYQFYFLFFFNLIFCSSHVFQAINFLGKKRLQNFDDLVCSFIGIA